MRTRHHVVLSLIGLLGCGDSQDSTTPGTTAPVTAGSTSGQPPTTGVQPSGSVSDSSDATSTEAPPTGSSGSEAGGPVFVSLQTSAKKITAGQSVTFTAVLTDPDGVADIIGGTLSSVDGMVGYGPFVAAGQAGTYSISVSWDALHQAEAIQFEKMELARTFRAEFLDQASHVATKDIEVMLFCDTGSACDGVCQDLATSQENCGACSHGCTDGCADGACRPVWGVCLDEEAGFATCDEYCASVGEKCVVNGCGVKMESTVVSYVSLSGCEQEDVANTYSEACDVVQPWTLGRGIIRCCCSESG